MPLRSLRVLLARKTSSISFAPEDSDLVSNALVGEQVIGTLTRLSLHGRYEPYLAESWQISDDKLVWDFKIRKGNRCEDGTEISAANYIAGLNRVLHLLAKHTDLPICNQIEGWINFKEGQDNLSGVTSPDPQTVRFRFASKPSSGFLEYLGLPYMGFYCASDFNPNGSWKDSKKVTSSAAFSILTPTGKFPIRLKKRKDWFSAEPRAADEILFESDSFENLKAKMGPNTALVETLENREAIFKGFQIVPLIPSVFAHVKINPLRSSFLNDVENRALIRDAIRVKRDSLPFPFPAAKIANSLYPQLTTQDSPSGVTIEKSKKCPKEPLVIMGANDESQLSKYMREVVEGALSDLRIPFRKADPTLTTKGHMEGSKDERSFDIKLGSVDVGGGIENQLIKFMFCTKLGTGFPDPSGRICNLVDEFETKYGDVMNDEAVKEYSERLNSIIYDDAGVVPLFHFGPSWIIGSDIDPSGFSPNMGIPYFDLVLFK